MQWPYEVIETHEQDALDRFTYLYEEMPKMKGLAEVFARRMQVIENSSYQLLTERWLDDAYGKQLDGIGSIVGEPRLARNDEPYRAAIKIRIGLNMGSGEPEAVIFVMRQLLETGVYSHLYPAGVLIETTNEPVTLQAQQGIVSVVPAGVGVTGLSTLHNGGIRIGSWQWIAITGAVQPYVETCLSQNMFAGRATASGASMIATVIPEITHNLQQKIKISRAAALGGSTIATLRPYV